VPTVCGLCPVGCNIHATTREGKVQRILARNHPEVDQGWLCDKGRFAFSHVRARDRLADPLRRVGPQRYEEVSWEAVLDEAERLLRNAGNRTVVALSGSETVEMAYALAKLLRQGLGAHTALLPENVNPLGPFRVPLSAIGDAELVVVLGDDPVVERAPIVDLWIRAARRNGAEVVTATEKEARDNQRLRDSERAVLIWSGPGGATLAALAADLGLHEKPGSGAFHLPQTANGRGVADAWAAAADEDAENPEPIGLLIVSGDEAAANPDVRAVAEQAESVVAISMFRTPVAGWTDLVLPGTSYLERDGTYVNLEGRLQRLRRAVIPPGPDELAWIAKLAERFGIELSPHAPNVFAEVSAIAYDGLAYGRVGERSPLPPREDLREVPKPRRPAAARGKGLRLVAYRPLFSGPAVERVPELQFQRPAAEIEVSTADARRLKVANGQTVRVRSNGTSVELRARVSRQLARGVARVPADHAQGLGTHVEIA
jgi:NADH-quinone oxidoreductase subunit G